MNAEHLIRMANQIGTFFDSMPDRGEALEGLVMHLKKFWDPRMRQAFLDLVDDESNAGRIDDIVRTAIRQHRALLV